MIVEVVHVEVDLVLQDSVDLLEDVRRPRGGGRGGRGRVELVFVGFMMARRRRMVVGVASGASEGVLARQGRIVGGREVIVTLLKRIFLDLTSDLTSGPRFARHAG